MIYETRKTAEFEEWLDGLKDQRALEKIAQRIVRMEAGLLGDVKFFDKIGELRIDYGPGYRVYFCRRGKILYLLLCGGIKRTQDADIERAKRMEQEAEL